MEETRCCGPKTSRRSSAQWFVTNNFWKYSCNLESAICFGHVSCLYLLYFLIWNLLEYILGSKSGKVWKIIDKGIDIHIYYGSGSQNRTFVKISIRPYIALQNICTLKLKNGLRYYSAVLFVWMESKLANFHRFLFLSIRLKENNTRTQM